MKYLEDRACDVFLIGAPKCGTTSIAHWLSEHPRICFSRIKEPHYYNDDMQNRTVRDGLSYHRLFQEKRRVEGGRCVRIEGSTWYLYSRTAVPNILRENPQARFIVAVRDPVAMCFSLYRHNRRFFHEDALTFEEAWKLERPRAGGLVDLPRLCEDSNYLRYREACSLGTLVRRVQGVVPAERLHVVVFDDVAGDPRATYQRILGFIGVEDDGRNEFPVLNEASVARSRAVGRLLAVAGRMKRRWGIQQRFGLFRLNEQRRRLPIEMSLATRDQVHRFFGAEIDMLSSAVGIDLSHWKEGASWR
jgi:hypothetical protein